jgi:hypothetical protein
MEDWRPMETAPLDGSTVKFKVETVVAAYWDAELGRFVLTRPLHLECIWPSADYRWQP